ncbi:hypothetical protein HBA54_28105 [Pelagibius litoralis]|uniref:Uncharacterized protein n=1 Tax=Pelagibius litoralis TaxID=374515 RepID=A0A967F427_9PROT|nr:hypothetical protein [Pelagibius litoralis]NIA72456.1 hypothetical protein [Pelagibius litoralis]
MTKATPMTAYEEMLEALSDLMQRTKGVWENGGNPQESKMRKSARRKAARAISRAQAEKAAEPTLREALKEAHRAIEDLLHAEQNPHSDKIQQKASDSVMAARRSERAALSVKAAKPAEREALEDLESRRDHFHQVLKEFGWGHKYTSRAFDDLALSGERARAALSPAGEKQ